MEIGVVVQRHKPALLQDRHVAQLRKQNLVNRPLFVEMGETPDKSYPGDNRLVGAESPYRRACSTPRCRLILSWGWRRSQGFGCSPIKRVRELGLDRRKTGWTLSAVGVDTWEKSSLVREDQDERTSGVPVVLPRALLGSYVRHG